MSAGDASTTVAAYRRGGADPNKVGHSEGGARARPDEATRPDKGGPEAQRIVVGFGFWIFLLSGIIMFSALFATFAVLRGATAGGPPGKALLSIPNVQVETALLLASSFACGMASVAAEARKMLRTQAALLITGLLGIAFVALELAEFAGLIAGGHGPGRSASLSAFFALVGCHGLHVGFGLLWLATISAQIGAKGFRPDMMRRLLCFGLFWHALDIIWIAVVTLVYLLGTR